MLRTCRENPALEVASKKARVEKLRRENESLERDVERFNEREKLQQEAADRRKKLPWLEFEKAKAKWYTAKEELAVCKQLVKVGGLSRSLCFQHAHSHSRSHVTHATPAPLKKPPSLTCFRRFYRSPSNTSVRTA